MIQVVLINSSITFYKENEDEQEQIINDMMKFIKEQNYNFFKSTGDSSKVLKKLSNDFGNPVASICLSFHQQGSNLKNLTTNFEKKIGFIAQDKVIEIIKDTSLDDCPLRFFRIL